MSERFLKAKAVIVTDFKGLTVSEMSSLRDTLRSKGGEYKVIKNTLAVKASKGTVAEKATDFFVGPTGIALNYENPIEIAKEILNFADKNEKLKIKCAIIDGSLLSLTDLKVISKLPSREVLLGMLAGTIQAPVSKLACAFSAPISKFMYLLEALKNKKSE
ncbi:MAG TPA: 50S ribosomal protein L10 [Nitrospirae bacterium]|nr:50S ribosomal protein L10 [Nitrospirota bacterium]